MSSKLLKDDINRLVDPTKKTTTSYERQSAAVISAARGYGNANTPKKVVVPTVVRKEAITVWSSIIVTADGAFEKPANWPIDGYYPTGAPIPDPLPDSLILDAGALALDIDIPFYEQKRVHLVVFTIGNQVAEDHLLVALEQPYNVGASDVCQGLDNYSSYWSPVLKLNFWAGSNAVVSDRVDELLGAGVLLGG
jgi:hypothetical protein